MLFINLALCGALRLPNTKLTSGKNEKDTFVASKVAWSHFSLAGENSPNPFERLLQNRLRTVPALYENRCLPINSECLFANMKKLTPLFKNHPSKMKNGILPSRIDF